MVDSPARCSASVLRWLNFLRGLIFVQPGHSFSTYVQLDHQPTNLFVCLYRCFIMKGNLSTRKESDVGSMDGEKDVWIYIPKRNQAIMPQRP